MVAGAFADLLGGEAKEKREYLSSLGIGHRTRARARAEERAEATHSLVLNLIVWVRLMAAILALCTVLIMVAITVTLAMHLIHGGFDSIAFKFSCSAGPILLSLGAFAIRRGKRTRGHIGQNNSGQEASSA